MGAKLEVEVRQPLIPQLGVKGIDILLDAEVVATTEFGGKVTVEAPVGDHSIRVQLRGVITRKSNVIRLAINEGDQIKIAAKYSVLWGSISIRKA